MNPNANTAKAPQPFNQAKPRRMSAITAILSRCQRAIARMVEPYSATHWRRAYEQEKKERLRLADGKWWYKLRVDMLAEHQSRMRDPERTLVCDIIANGQLLPDPDGARYGQLRKPLASKATLDGTPAPHSPAPPPER